MAIRFHRHALERMEERGASMEEVKVTTEKGEQFPAKFGRTGFRCNFPLRGKWRGKHYHTKQVEAYAAPEGFDWRVITVITRYF